MASGQAQRRGLQSSKPALRSDGENLLHAESVGTLPNAAVARVVGELAIASRETIIDVGEATWAGAPSEGAFQNYWRGVLLAPHRHLILGRVDGRVAGALQLVRQGQFSELGSDVFELKDFFIAPWAQGIGLAPMLLHKSDEVADAEGAAMINLSVRATRLRAIAVFEAAGFKRWGEKADYAKLGDRFVPGYFYSKSFG
ncbi:MAG: GNAT family N-acetyltransferase [Pseudomonadota bacterium]